VKVASIDSRAGALTMPFVAIYCHVFIPPGSEVVVDQ
jgi:hypothetical protein